MTVSLASSGDLDLSTCGSRIQQLCSGIGAQLRNSQIELLSSGIEQVPTLLRIVILMTTWQGTTVTFFSHLPCRAGR